MKIVNVLLSNIKVTDYIIIVILLFSTTILGLSINSMPAIQNANAVIPEQQETLADMHAHSPAILKSPLIKIKEPTKLLTKSTDKFGVKEIYPTKTNGREWYINMDDPQADKTLIIDNYTLVKENDGSWRIGSTEGATDAREFNGRYHIIIGVNTPPGQEPWKNVEITGYAKVIATSSDSNYLQWYARGANHTSEAPCEGTALKGRIRVDGEVAWVKEIWHDGGYTQNNDTSRATKEPLIGRWIGWKVVIYNINNDTAVKMKSYLDNNNNNHWRKVTDFTDRGGWYSDSPDNVFYSAGCGYPKDYVITGPGPIASFRSDGIAWDFKNLSVREIESPVTTMKTKSNS
jgi:hypothetical protein